MATQLRNLVGHGISKITLVADKLQEWDMFNRFLEQNPNIKEKYETYKTFEILNNDH